MNRRLVRRRLDELELRAQARQSPPEAAPDEIDYEAMSDGELKALYLEKLAEPMDSEIDYNGLTDEQLAQLYRDGLEADI